MAIFSNTWTGRETAAVLTVAAPVATAVPIKSSKLQPRPAEPMRDAQLAEYTELAAAVGIMPPDLGIEKFKAFLLAHDIPTFALPEVIAYMDRRAEAESKEKCGWCWRPLRKKDNREDATFGTKAVRQATNRDVFREPTGVITTPASDYYEGPKRYRHHDSNGQEQEYVTLSSAQPYNRTIPLHALRKVALIEKEFGDTVGLFVSDYALAPAIEYPDPFLMAVVANPNVANGTGRFVIDFWDEPGFGIQQMMK